MSYTVEWVDGLDAVYGGSDNYIAARGHVPVDIAISDAWLVPFRLSGQNPPNQHLCSPDFTIMRITSQDLTTSTNTDVLMPDLKYGNSAPNVCTFGSYPDQISAAVTSSGAVTICGGQGSPPTYNSSKLRLRPAVAYSVSFAVRATPKTGRNGGSIERRTRTHAASETFACRKSEILLSLPYDQLCSSYRPDRRRPCRRR